MDWSDYSADTIPVPRDRVLILRDGSFAVQWEDRRVQTLLDGKYRVFSPEDRASDISDYELNQLMDARIISDYNDGFVFLRVEMDHLETPTRTFYLNTTHDKSRLREATIALEAAGLQRQYSLRIIDDFVVVRGPDGMAFASFDEAEQTRIRLVGVHEELFGAAVVAFIEVLPPV